jgi:hypothetical protein
MEYNKSNGYNDEDMFNKIDTPDKAYIIGYMLSVGCICSANIRLSSPLAYREILEYISRVIGGDKCKVLTVSIGDKRFLGAMYETNNKNIITDVNKHSGKSGDRHLPIVKKELKRYLLLGFFDGKGYIDWGKRKDRNKVWQKISLISRYRLLEGVQNILIDEVNASSKIRPKGKGKQFILEISNKEDVLKFLDYIYPNDLFIISHRKYKKANALRLELGEFREDPRTLSETI